MRGGGGYGIRCPRIVDHPVTAFGDVFECGRTVGIEGYAFVIEAVGLDLRECAAKGMADLGNVGTG